MPHMVTTWRSTKNPDGTFTARVYSFGYQVPSVLHFEFTRRTRAQAVGIAKKYVLAMRQQAKAS